MSGFYVDPDGMTALANQVRRAGEDAQASLAHIRRYADLSWVDEGLIFIFLFHIHGDIFESVTKEFEQVGALAEAFSDRIVKAQAAYRRVDRTTAAQLDEFFGAPDKRPPKFLTGGSPVPSLFTDVEPAQKHLTAPDTD